MKKIFTVLLCTIMMMWTMAFVVNAEESALVEVETATAETISEAQSENPLDTPIFTTEELVIWVESHFEEISVIVTLICTLIYQIRKQMSLNKSIGIMNNNTIAVSENSSAVISQALLTMNNVSDTVATYKNEISTLLAEVRGNEEKRQRLEDTLVTVEQHLKLAKMANTELANEVAELLVLANIPNSKKDELYARHRAAVSAINAVETVEVKEDGNERT